MFNSTYNIIQTTLCRVRDNQVKMRYKIIVTINNLFLGNAIYK